MSEKQTPREFVIDEVKKWLMRTFLLGVAAVCVFLFQPTKERLQAVWSTPARLVNIEVQLAEIQKSIVALAGENRVISEAPELSYVKEPVHKGEKITLFLVLKRTQLGETCVLRERTALFSDETNITIAGPPTRPARQANTDMLTYRVALDVPDAVQPGRVTVKLSLFFECGGKPVYDATTPVAFTLLPPKGQ